MRARGFSIPGEGWSSLRCPEQNKNKRQIKVETQWLCLINALRSWKSVPRIAAMKQNCLKKTKLFQFPNCSLKIDSLNVLDICTISNLLFLVFRYYILSMQDIHAMFVC
jgi:hypothetical protein